MKKRILSAIVSAAMLASLTPVFAQPAAAADANTPKLQSSTRVMEELNRGLIATYRTANSTNGVEAGVYLSWRLLGKESLTNQAFDIYRSNSENGEYTKIATTAADGPTNYIDKLGSASNWYKVVTAGASAAAVSGEKAVKPGVNHVAQSSQYTNLKNSFTYMDIPIERPDPVARTGDDKTSSYYTIDKEHEGGANDGSVGDLDGDGDYELILKWDPTDSKDSAGADYTGNCYIDAYEIDPNNNAANNPNGHLYKWRIDLGRNVTSGAHYTQFIVYDFDNDGRAEIAMKTAPGTVDGTGHYVTEVGDTDAIRNADNNAIYVGTAANEYLGSKSSRLKGKNPFVQYLTVFDGETGRALATTEYIPYEAAKDKYWGDGSAKYNRSERYLAGVAYLDGVNPSIIMCRGYYHDSIIRAYNWDGTDLTMLWEHNGNSAQKDTTLYGQGNHNLTIGDIDNDGKDEIVYGSAALDNDGKTVLGNTKLGHGDAIHMNDFNNDGVQEVFSVKEDKEGYANNAANFRVPTNSNSLWGHGASGDTGRGVMDNIDDNYASSHPDGLALAWSSSHDKTFDLKGNEVAAKPAAAGNGSFDNSLVFWDGDLGRELLDANIIQKYDATNAITQRFWGESNGYTLTDGATNNYTKRNATLSADLWGDWREEIIMPINKGDSTGQAALRIFTSTIWTDYRLTTLMHDCQYREAIAWQNVGYNQPPHTSYYVGSASLATDSSGKKLNYLAPAYAFTNVIYPSDLESLAVTGLDIIEDTAAVEKGNTATLTAVLSPEGATRKSIAWTSSDPTVATVANGIVKGIKEGTVTITATAKDTTNGVFSDTCTVNVYANHVNAVALSDRMIEIGSGNSKKLEAIVSPDNATDKTVTWKSDDEGIAKVSSDGTVTGVGYGKTTVTATTTDGEFSAKCIVRVKPIAEVDLTGKDLFVSDTNTSDFAGTATSGKLTLANSNNDISEFHKDFDVVDSNKAKLSFRLVTGGIKNGDSWNWTGREYELHVKLLDENGNNIITMNQPYNSSAGKLTSTIGTNNAENFETAWTKITDGLGNIQGSVKRWVVNAVFDYNTDTATVTIMGTDATFETDSGKYSKTFKLNGASFKRLQVETKKTGTGAITASPDLSAASYVASETVSGSGEQLYERGLSTAWKEADLTDWVQTNTGTAALQLDTENKRVWYNPTAPGTSYDASKTFDIKNNSQVSYDVDWYTESQTNASTYEYIKFGSDVVLAWKVDYNVYFSTDGGKTWSESPLFTGANRTSYNFPVSAVFDTRPDANGRITLKSLKFNNNVVATDVALAENATVNKFSFGMERGGTPVNWAYPNGINSISVSQFTYGEEAPDISALTITGVEGKTVNYDYSVVNDGFVTTDYTKASIVGVLYDAEKLVEIQTKPMTSLTLDETLSDSITFAKDVEGKTIKLMMWDSVGGLVPISEKAIR